jgi:hypothetical protein
MTRLELVSAAKCDENRRHEEIISSVIRGTFDHPNKTTVAVSSFYNLWLLQMTDLPTFRFVGIVSPPVVRSLIGKIKDRLPAHKGGRRDVR